MSTRPDTLPISPADAELSRRRFMRLSVLIAAGSQLPWLAACSDRSEEEPLSFLQSVVDHLFPRSQSEPGALDFMSDAYIEHIMSDPEEPESYREKLKKGFDLISDKSEGDFSSLSAEDKDELINSLNEEKWSKGWLRSIMTLIVESMLMDPHYGYNPDGVGWNWLGHTPGAPRPTADTIYPLIYQRIYHG